jgi:betaine-aldehyde dehydrogenase
VQAAKAAQIQWGTTTGAQRAAILRKIADIVEANADPIAKKEAINAGKPLKESAWDVSDVSVAFRLRLTPRLPFSCLFLRSPKVDETD